MCCKDTANILYLCEKHQAEGELVRTIGQAILAFDEISEAAWAAKPSPEKWSKKEILGHLADSTATNWRRFVVSQYQENDKIVYDQNAWVAMNDYANMEQKEIQGLWLMLNRQIAKVWQKMPDVNLAKTCISNEQHDLQFFMEDYLKHLHHHLGQIIGK